LLHGMAVRAAVAKSREEARARAKAKAARKLEQEEAARRAQDAEEAEKNRLLARVDLGRAIAVGNDKRAAEATELVDMELLAAPDRQGSTPLHGCASRGLELCCRKILKRDDFRPEMLQARDPRGWTPLHCAAAAASGSPELCSMLADHKACSLDARDLTGRTALDVAREWGMMEAAAVLMNAAHARQPDPMRTTLTIQTPSSVSSKSPSRSPTPAGTASPPPSSAKSAGAKSSGAKSAGARKTLPAKLSSAEASPKPTPKASRKSVHPKARRKSKERAAEDVEGEAAEAEPVEAPDDGLAGDSIEEGTQSDLAAGDSIQEETEKVLPAAVSIQEETEKDLEETEKDLAWNASAAIEAVVEDRLEDAVEIIVRPLWPFVNEVDKRGRNLLHLGAIRGSVELCTAVLDRDDFEGADKFDNDRATALHLAAANRHVEVCIALVASGRILAVNAQDMRDQTPLHLAALRGDEDCYNAILAHEDCDVSVRDYKRRIAPDYANERGIEAEGQDPLDNKDLQIDL